MGRESLRFRKRDNPGKGQCATPSMQCRPLTGHLGPPGHLHSVPECLPACAGKTGLLTTQLSAASCSLS